MIVMLEITAVSWKKAFSEEFLGKGTREERGTFLNARLT